MTTLLSHNNIGILDIVLNKTPNPDTESVDLGSVLLSCQGRVLQTDVSHTLREDNRIRCRLEHDTDEIKALFPETAEITLLQSDLSLEELTATIYVSGEADDSNPWEITSMSLEILDVDGVDSITVTEED